MVFLKITGDLDVYLPERAATLTTIMGSQQAQSVVTMMAKLHKYVQVLI